MQALRSLLAGALALAAVATAASEPAVHAVDIKNGAVARAQRTLVVAHESAVALEWTADRAMTVHLEGYDISVVVRPGNPATMKFKAHATGRFAVHAHEGDRAGTAHSHGRGALMWLEVHPR